MMGPRGHGSMDGTDFVSILTACEVIISATTDGIVTIAVTVAVQHTLRRR
jgi:hypothetical protein